MRELVYSFALAAFLVGMLGALTGLRAEGEVGRAELDRVEAVFGRDARARVESWNRLLVSPRASDERQVLAEVNSFFNELWFVDDSEHWGKDDYWATPVEFLASGGGDCEDFAIAKYFTLKYLGIAEDRMRLTYVKALDLNQAHMVLAYYPAASDEPLILDNLISEILPASSRKDLLPVYSFNGDGLWLAKERGAGRLVGKSDRLSRWQALHKRMREAVIAAPAGRR